MQFYVLMIDYSRSLKRAMGLEAIVQPELTRREIVEQARDVLAEGRNSIAFVKFVDGNYIEDVTDEIIAEAALSYIPPSLADIQAAKFDHARDDRKHGSV